MWQFRDKDSLALPLILLAVMFGWNLFLGDPPAVSGRPDVKPNERAATPFSQEARARLWQDPVRAAEEHMKSLGPQFEKSATGTGDSLKQLQARNLQMVGRLWAELDVNAGELRSLRVLAVTMRGGPYGEDGEQRLRTRAAVVSALGNAGFQPAIGDSLGILQVPRSAFYSSSSGVDGTAIVPFERFEPDPIKSNADLLMGSREPVLVLWLNDQDFPGRVLNQGLATLLSLIDKGVSAPKAEKGKEEPSHFRFVVHGIGPCTSGDLVKMRPENSRAGLWNSFQWSCGWALWNEANDDVRKIWISPWASISPDGLELFPAQDATDWPPVGRSTATDNRLCKLLIDELQLRPCEPAFRWPSYTTAAERVLLISEADTPYARSLVDEFDKYFCATFGISARFPNSRIVEVEYLRGIDGLAASEFKRIEQTRAREDAAATATPEGVLRSRKESSDQKAFGEAQTDYFLRLVERVRTLEAASNIPFTAIGVLGTDFYDKGLILQVLRANFPCAVFFTTELDARMLAPEARAWAKNLIVASSYGLELPKELQQQTAPFRDSSQTGLYFTVLRAVGFRSAVEEWPFRPLSGSKKHSNYGLDPQTLGAIYEIGYSMPHRLTSEEASKNLLPPDPRRTFPIDVTNWRFLGSTIALMLICLLLSFGWHWTAGAESKTNPLFGRHQFQTTLPGATIGAIISHRRYVNWKEIRRILLCKRASRRPRPSGMIAGGAAAATGGSWFRTLLKWKTSAVFCITLDGIFATAVLLLAIFLPWLVSFLQTPGYGGEPQNWPNPDGVNAWPTLIITFIVMIFALAEQRKWLSHRPDQIRQFMREYQLWDDKVKPAHITWLSQWKLKKGKPDAKKAWHQYEYLARAENWTTRCVPFVVGYMLFGLLLWWIVLRNPFAPIRGGITFYSYVVINLLAALVISWLVFLAWDATRLCEMLIRQLRADTTKYPSDAYKLVKVAPGVSDDAKSCYLDIRLVGEHSAQVARLIYAPMIVLFVVLAARNQRFDSWATSPTLLLTAGILWVVLVGSALSLRSAAGKLRTEELRRLCEEIGRVRNLPSKGPFVAPSQSSEIAQLEQLIKAIHEYERGAFNTLGKHPLVTGVLVPFAGAILLVVLNRIFAP